MLDYCNIENMVHMCGISDFAVYISCSFIRFRHLMRTMQMYGTLQTVLRLYVQNYIFFVQPYGNADLGESVTVHAGGQQHPPRVDNTNERGREVGGKGHGGMEEQELEATCRDNIASYPSKFAQKGGISKQLEGRSGGSERKEDGGVEEGKRGGDHEARGQARTSFRKLVGQQTPDVISTEAGEGMTDIGVSRGEGEERQRAVVKIQAWLRGVLCRRGVRQYRIRRHAAITIQATW